MGRGREALEILNAPEIMQDAASHLWAALAAEAIGDPTEARKQFQLGVPAPVSYTHLDVYKRQIICCCRRIKCRQKDITNCIGKTSSCF